jgi:hypothetical protein
MLVDIGACFPVLDGDEMARLGDAFMHVIGDAARLAAGGGDAGPRGCDEPGAGVGAHLRPRDDENDVGHLLCSFERASDGVIPC